MTTLLIVNVWYLELCIYFIWMHARTKSGAGYVLFVHFDACCQGHTFIDVAFLLSCVCIEPQFSFNCFLHKPAGGSLIEGLCSYTCNEGI